MFCFSLHLSQSNGNVLIPSSLLTVFEMHAATCPCSLILMHMYNSSGGARQEGSTRVPRGAGSKRAGNKLEPFLNPGRA